MAIGLLARMRPARSLNCAEEPLAPPCRHHHPDLPCDPPPLLALLLAPDCLRRRADAQTVTVGTPPATFTLANGMNVVVIPDHRTPVVTQMVWYKVGSADETPGKSGLAHFLEHLMFKGTANHPAGEFSQTVQQVGGSENAFTSTDYTGYYQRVPRTSSAG